jgi:uncharacterized cupin superfamily protein
MARTTAPATATGSAPSVSASERASSAAASTSSPSGEKTWPYHYEIGCEEWLIAVSGRPTLRGPDGERELKPGDFAVFPEGPAGGHQVINRSNEPCRVLILSSKAPHAILHYPDSGKVGLWSRAEGYQSILRGAPTLDYWEGES